MSHFPRALEKWRFFSLLLPLPLVISPLLYVLTYFLHIPDSLAFGINSSIRVGVAALVCLVILTMSLRRRRPGTRKVTILLLGFFGVSFAWAYVEHGFDPILKQTIAKFLVNVVPALLVGVYATHNKLGREFLSALEKYGWVFFPVALIYIARFFIFSSEIYSANLRSLGALNSMSIAYAFLPLFAASCILLLEPHSGAMEERRIRWCVILVYWFAIICSQTKGALLGGFFFLCVLVVKGDGRGKRGRSIALLLACTFIFFASGPLLKSVFGLPFKLSNENIEVAFSSGGAGEVGGGWQQSSSVPPGALELSMAGSAQELSMAGHQARQYLLANRDNGVEFDRGDTDCSIRNREIAKQIALDKGLREALTEAGCTVSLSRIALLEIALQEFVSNPLYGMGPLGFQIRYYGNSPHNVIIEFLVEFGAVLGACLLSGLVHAVAVGVSRGRSNVAGQTTIPFVAIYVPMFLVSGSIWTNAMFAFSLACTITLFFAAAEK